MRRVIPAAAVLAVLVGVIATNAAGVGQSTPTTPAARRRCGSPTSRATRAASRAACARSTPHRGQSRRRRRLRPPPRRGAGPADARPNVQMNDDSYPPLPQNETAVAYNVLDPKIAVAAANDYVSGGVVVMRTSDGGKHWATTRITPQFGGTGDFCNGGDPGVAYSRGTARSTSRSCASSARCPSPRCRSTSPSTTARPGRRAARPRARRPTSTTPRGTVDESVFNDKELIAVDNNPSSPHYGRIYVTYTKFHLQPNGFSDYCPIQLSYTDSIPTAEPACCRPGRTPPFSRTTPAVTAPAPRPTSSATPWSRRTARSTSGSSPRTATTPSTRTCSSSARPTAGRRSSRARCRSTSPGSTRTSTTARVPTPSRPRTSARRTRRRWPTARRPATLLYVYQNNINRPTSQADISYQTSSDGGLHWSDAKFLSTDVVRPAGRQRPVLPVGRIGRERALLRDLVRPPARPRQRTDQHVAGGLEQRRGELLQRQDQHARTGIPTTGSSPAAPSSATTTGSRPAPTPCTPVWTDGRDNAIGETGIGETDIFTNVQKK